MKSKRDHSYFRVSRYGQPTPPEYNVRNIHETPIGLYWSANDWLADPKDVAVLAQRLPSLAVNFEVSQRSGNGGVSRKRRRDRKQAANDSTLESKSYFSSFSIFQPHHPTSISNRLSKTFHFIRQITEQKFTHVDFLIGMTARKLVYQPILEFFSKY